MGFARAFRILAAGAVHAITAWLGRAFAFVGFAFAIRILAAGAVQAGGDNTVSSAVVSGTSKYVVTVPSGIVDKIMRPCVKPKVSH